MSACNKKNKETTAFHMFNYCHRHFNEPGRGSDPRATSLCNKNRSGGLFAAILAAPTKFQFRPCFNMGRGGKIAKSYDPTSWIASLTTLKTYLQKILKNSRKPTL